MEIRKIPISQITPASYNPRKDLQPDDPEYRIIHTSLKTFGLVLPLVWNKQSGNLVGGHQRLKMEIAKGESEIDVSVVDLSPEEEKALNIALNNSHGANDNPKLASILEELRVNNPEMVEAAGYDEERFEELMAQFSGGDETPPKEPTIPVPVEAITKPGDVWEFEGGHRLACGDCTKKSTWKGLFDRGERAQAVITDPPYGISYEGAAGTIEGDDLRGDNLRALLAPAFALMSEKAGDDAAFYIWHAARTRRDFEAAMDTAGLAESQTIVWVKDQFNMGRSDYHYQAELCFYGHKVGHRAKWAGDRTQSTVWRVNPHQGAENKFVSLGGGVLLEDEHGNQLFITDRPPKKKKVRTVRAESGGVLAFSGGEDSDAWMVTHTRRDYDHPTQKPVELAARSMRNSTQAGDTVLDPFAGAGFVLLAAEALNRRARCIELEPKFCDVICRRYMEATGHSPVRKADGVKFSEAIFDDPTE